MLNTSYCPEKTWIAGIETRVLSVSAADTLPCRTQMLFEVTFLGSAVGLFSTYLHVVVHRGACCVIPSTDNTQMFESRAVFQADMKFIFPLNASVSLQMLLAHIAPSAFVSA